MMLFRTPNSRQTAPTSYTDFMDTSMDRMRLSATPYEIAAHLSRQVLVSDGRDAWKVDVGFPTPPPSAGTYAAELAAWLLNEIAPSHVRIFTDGAPEEDCPSFIVGSYTGAVREIAVAIGSCVDMGGVYAVDAESSKFAVVVLRRGSSGWYTEKLVASLAAVYAPTFRILPAKTKESATEDTPTVDSVANGGV